MITLTILIILAIVILILLDLTIGIGSVIATVWAFASGNIIWIAGIIIGFLCLKKLLK